MIDIKNIRFIFSYQVRQSEHVSRLCVLGPLSMEAYFQASVGRNIYNLGSFVCNNVNAVQRLKTYNHLMSSCIEMQVRVVYMLQWITSEELPTYFFNV